MVYGGTDPSRRTGGVKDLSEGRLTRHYRRVPPHCDLTGRLAETGLVGGASLIALWLTWLHGMRAGLFTGPPMERAASAAVIGFLVNSVNADVMNFRFLWLALAWTSWAAARPDPAAAPEASPSR